MQQGTIETANGRAMDCGTSLIQELEEQRGCTWKAIGREYVFTWSEIGQGREKGDLLAGTGTLPVWLGERVNWTPKPMPASPLSL